MKEKAINTRICNYVCAALLLCLLVTQFLPFWNCTDCKKHEDGLISISDYIWLPDNHKTLTKGMTQVYLDTYGENYTGEDGKAYKFAVDDIVLPPVVVLAMCVLGIVLCIRYAEKAIVAIIPLIGGLAGVYGYLTLPPLRIGQGWGFHLAIAIAVVVAAIISMVVYIIEWSKKRKRF